MDQESVDIDTSMERIEFSNLQILDTSDGKETLEGQEILGSMSDPLGDASHPHSSPPLKAKKKHGKKLSYKRPAEEPVIKAEASKKARFFCEICDKGYGYKHHLDRHIKSSHKQKGQKPFKCEMCDHSYVDKQGLNRHISSIHKETKFPCPHCDQEFTRDYERNKHKKKLCWNSRKLTK